MIMGAICKGIRRYRESQAPQGNSVVADRSPLKGGGGVPGYSDGSNPSKVISWTWHYKKHFFPNFKALSWFLVKNVIQHWIISIHDSDEDHYHSEQITLCGVIKTAIIIPRNTTGKGLFTSQTQLADFSSNVEVIDIYTCTYEHINNVYIKVSQIRYNQISSEWF